MSFMYKNTVITLGMKVQKIIYLHNISMNEEIKHTL